MSGLAMPPAEPPAPEVDEVLEQLRVARVEHGHAAARLARVQTWAADPMNSAVDRMKFRVAGGARRHEVQLWDDEILELEARARTLGLRP